MNHKKKTANFPSYAALHDAIRVIQASEYSRCLNDLIRVCDLAPKSVWNRRALTHSFNHLDHFKGMKTRDRQELILDAPYIPSCPLIDEQKLLDEGFRILHLPMHMSPYIVGKTQPRLIAHSSSQVDLALIVRKLALAKFRGNATLTHDFIGRVWPMDADIAQAFKSAIENPHYGEDMYLRLKELSK
jgi:hypothetical protein